MKKYEVFDKENTAYYYYADIVETHNGELWGYGLANDNPVETLWVLPKGQWTEMRLVPE